MHNLMKVMDITRENSGGMNGKVFVLKDGLFVSLQYFAKYLSIFRSA